ASAGANRYIMVATILPNDSATTVATKIVAAINQDRALTATASGNSFTVVNVQNGALASGSVGTSGFAVVSSVLATAANFAVLANSTITNTGSTVITGNLGLYPGTSVTGFPPGTVSGVEYITNSVAQQAEVDAASAY